MGAGGGAAGIVAGVLFGDACAMLRPVGLAYVGLLEAAVYPYLITFLMPPNSPGAGALRELLAGATQGKRLPRAQMSDWIEGPPRDTTARRWSVVRDVLGWTRAR